MGQREVPDGSAAKAPGLLCRLGVKNKASAYFEDEGLSHPKLRIRLIPRHQLDNLVAHAGHQRSPRP